MFGKRLRKEETASNAASCRREAAAVAAAAADTALELAASSSLCSIELATPSSSAALPRNLSSSGTPLEGVVGPPRRPVERGSVRSKAAYFEALCRANTTLHIECSTEGVRHSSHPPIQGIDNDTVEDCPAGAVFACDTDMAAADSDADEAGSWQDFSEVHLLLRMPRGSGPSMHGSGSGSGSSKYGSVAEMEALVEQLQQALVVKEAQRKAAVDAFRRRSNEADNLQRVVRELSEGRAKVAVQRAMLADKYADLQQEYHRMLRIADLSRTVSKEHVASTSRTRSELRRVQSELHATKGHAQSLSEKQKKVRVELLLLKEKVQLLERFDFEEMQESVCKRQFTRYRVAETY